MEKFQWDNFDGKIKWDFFIQNFQWNILNAQIQ